ncbi:hypothetical protein DJ568_08745 [Mucilaginibacter hurinus]|uniref:DUF3828 domain-containing protein n=1 Tax=Mucilaginibacter hurinus TaxID=2201324 RepID=A0A367GP47_9SPHI|nr:hypothetical protein [Mucilaginibacter hurinus]RCH55262.1 hypothetical protein DJ568_08745 [Mucilaginibacter hurinus]
MNKLLLVFIVLIKGLILQAQNELSEKQTQTELLEFYKQYITIVASGYSENKSTFLKKKYCTKNLIAKLPQLIEECDCDPFLKAQDSNIRFLRTLSIKQAKEPNTYKVSYIADDRIIINLTVIKQNKSVTIARIW